MMLRSARRSLLVVNPTPVYRLPVVIVDLLLLRQFGAGTGRRLECDCIRWRSRSSSARLEKRRREFAAGRSCARRALSQLGMYNVAIPVGLSASPAGLRHRWQHHAFVAATVPGCCTDCSRARARHRCRLTSCIGLRHNVRFARPTSSRRWRALAANVAGVNVATLVFSAKESVYKVWYR